ncbi:MULTISPECIES: hypothetical protein [unclassified Streptomyces]|uniref:hypothetical protein n=1 Tax=unclassified Streptomyces TaxID=2593676 RepID=UPI0011632C3A|nr:MULTISPECIES: hypothetical protein [unclassified Streptomyces]NMI57131.1 hypothetical protein [Streptomyces sp. RLA2-12]QDN56505.1 hypothetical protein FNV67_15425 [Streptomyces sp. S1D4-20]QDN66682.1 hypothetical protein FNV66_15020 [Streptomyces sp. S1D4-14]QDO49089.1 hypothetical protein FNV60_13270 [Streptomyces sp. RLB3-5]QDO59330.1 hypothetical protein FNV59_15515 [Streptomyces sp. RLB1-8]
MIHLLTSPRTARTVRSLLGTVADAVRSVIAPASLVEQEADVEPATAPDPAGLYEADEMPDTDAIEAAAREFERAADQARRADRGKRAAKKVLDRLPSGVYGAWRVFRTPSSRQTPDLAEITATYKRLGLGPVPMKACAPSLKVEAVDIAVPVAV